MRLLSLDVFRGLTIAMMILVNSPGNQETYPLLEHATWNGCTLADLVFPFFLVIVGVSTVLAFTHLKNKGFSNQQLLIKIVKRSFYLFMVGLLLNAFPNHINLVDVRILGVLQRIAICYFFSSILYLTTHLRTQKILISIILISYYILMNDFPTTYPLTTKHNIVGFVDRFILSSNHLYTAVFDPEGLLSTIPAIASTLFGNILGFCLISPETNTKKLRWMIVTGLLATIFGFCMSLVCPFNKSLWSSSYVLWTSGLAYLGFASCFVLIEMKKWTKWTMPFKIFGQNALLVYVLHVFFLKAQAMIHIQNASHEIINLRMYITECLFGRYSHRNASLSYAILYTIFWLYILRCKEKISFMRKNSSNR